MARWRKDFSLNPRVPSAWSAPGLRERRRNPGLGARRSRIKSVSRWAPFGVQFADFWNPMRGQNSARNNWHSFRVRSFRAAKANDDDMAGCCGGRDSVEEMGG